MNHLVQCCRPKSSQIDINHAGHSFAKQHRFNPKKPLHTIDVNSLDFDHNLHSRAPAFDFGTLTERPGLYINKEYETMQADLKEQRDRLDEKIKRCIEKEEVKELLFD